MIHYAECDPVELYQRDRTFYSWVKVLFLYLLYRMPIQMVSMGNAIYRPFPSLSSKFLEKTVRVRVPQISDISPFRHTRIYRRLCQKSDIRVLWLMGMELDHELVVPGEYEKIIEECVRIAVSACPAREQGVKYHPRARARINVWDAEVERFPEHIPAEFLELPNLEIILSVSSAASKTMVGSSKIKNISLIKLIPFVNEATQQQYEQTVNWLFDGLDYYLPDSLSDLRHSLNNFQKKGTY